MSEERSSSKDIDHVSRATAREPSGLLDGSEIVRYVVSRVVLSLIVHSW